MRHNTGMSENRILIVDDSPENLELLALLLERNGWEYDMADSGRSAIQRLEERRYDLVITDLMMPEMNGLELLQRLKERWSGTEVVIVTAYGSIPTAIEAIKKGAYSYLMRPFEPDEVALMIRKIFELLKIRSENTMLREELSRARGFERIVGKGPEMQKIFQMIDTVAQTNSTVLVLGESGSGKELVARAIHQKSSRASQPFIKVSCAALPEGLLESELFGHEKGAFTGAVSERKGRFELANKGTLFLDEIGEISQAVQVKLLRAIQEREFERIGSSKTLHTDTRIISATNRNLADEVEKGGFRADLYYRLNVITIEPPPLMKRKDDIPLLVYHFLEKYRTETSKDISGVSDDALSKLTSYRWPGNVRELQNVIERAVVLCQGNRIESIDLPDAVSSMKDGVTVPGVNEEPTRLLPLKVAKSRWEKTYIERALLRFDGNVTKTAQGIGIARKNLQEKIKSYEIGVRKETGDF